MKLGNFNIELLETGRFGLDGGAMFGVVPKNLWTKAYHEPDEQNRIPMAARVLLIQTGDKNILVDTGNGSKMPEKLVQIYGIDNSQFTLEASLNEFALAPEDISHVILTHLHFDHSGGSTMLQNGEITPTFPNARYLVQKDHWEWAHHASEKDRASFIAENYEPLFADGMIEFIDGEGELFPDISLILSYGHTRALQMVKVQQGSEVVLFPADLFPTSAHIKVPFGMGYDNFPLTTIDEKKNILPQAVEEEWIICFEHDAFTQAAKLAHSDKGFVLSQKIQVTKQGQ